jgi:hypothetical protein
MDSQVVINSVVLLRQQAILMSSATCKQVIYKHVISSVVLLRQQPILMSSATCEQVTYKTGRDQQRGSAESADNSYVVCNMQTSNIQTDTSCVVCNM